MASFIAKQMMGNQLNSVKGNSCTTLPSINSRIVKFVTRELIPFTVP